MITDNLAAVENCFDWLQWGLHLVGCEPVWLTALPGWRETVTSPSLWKQTGQSRSANHGWARAPGVYLTYAKDFLKTKTHTNTHTHRHHIFLFYVLSCFVGYMSVYVLRFICVHVRMLVCWADVCFLPVWCGLLSTPSPGRWRSCHGRVLSRPRWNHTHMRTHTHTHTHTSGDRGQLVLKDQINQVFTPPTHRRQDKQTEKRRRW